MMQSNGGLTAGRGNSDNALFPYCTEDKIEDNASNTGSRTIIWAERNGKRYVWEPFSKTGRGLYDTTMNLYKNVVGNKLVFEEVNHDIELTFRQTWQPSERFGFVRTSTLSSQRGGATRVEVLDGIATARRLTLPPSVQRAEAFHVVDR